MKFKKLLAMAGTAIMSSMALSAPVLAASVTQLQNVYDMVSVEDSTLDFPLFVYGAGASIEDFVTATEAAAKFQSFAVVEESVEIAGGEEVVTGGVKFEQPGDALITGEEITNVLDSVGASNMDILASGTFVTEEGSSYEYNQYIDFGDAGNTDPLSVDMYNEGDSDIDPAYMFRVTEDDVIYTYSLEFPEAVDYDVATDDLEGSAIDWLGQTWTILDVTEVADVITAMELISGKAVQTVVLNTPATFSSNGDSYTVELIAVNINENAATLNIDGASYVVNQGVTKTLSDGTSVTVTDIFASSKESTPDSCKVFIGARKVVLSDGDELEVEDDAIDGTTVTLNSAADQLTGWEIEVTAEDDVYLYDGDEFVDPIAEAFSIQYTGYQPASEDDWTEISITPSGRDRVTMSFVNKDGNKINVPLAYDATGDQTAWGYSDDKLLVLDEATNIREDDYFFVSSTNGYFTHLLQVVSMDSADDELKLKNIGTGSTFTISTPGDVGEIRLNNKIYEVTDEGGDEITVDMTGDGDYIDDFYVGGDGFVFTEFGTYSAAMQFDAQAVGTDCEAGVPAACDAGLVEITEGLQEDGVTAYVIDVEIGFGANGASTDDIEVKEPTTDDGYDFSYETGDLMEVSDDVSAGATTYGTYVEFDSDNNDATIMYPPYQVYHNLYVGDAISVSSGASGTVTTQTFLQPMDFSRLDTQVTETDKLNRDMVLWGGPCVNTLVAGLDAFPYTCDTWPAENFGQLTLINGAYASGKTVLVAAGTRAADTQLLGDVLSDGTKLEGVTASSAKITGTSVSNVVIQ